jgi:hypothetical protein
MSLQIGDAIGDGLRRSLSVSGGVLMALMFAFVLAFMSATNTVFMEVLPPEVQETGQFGLTLPVSAAVAGGIAAVAMLFGLVFSIAMTRALTREHAELSSFPSSLFTRRIGRALVSMIGASFVIQLAVTIGMAFLLVPGLFLAVSFMFAAYAIGVEDERAIDSLSRSWELASGNRWGLFGLTLLVAVGVGVGVGSGLGSILMSIDPVTGQVATLALTTVLTVLGQGIIADAYVQLRDDENRGGSGGAETSDVAGTAV